MKLPSPKEAEVLQLLISKGEMYGLQMVLASEGALKRGTVYVLLDRLEDQGFIQSRPETEQKHSGLTRRLYRVTGLGQQALAAVRSARALMQPMPTFSGA
jgi:DNA-binding PadR family transcriptional regulator